MLLLLEPRFSQSRASNLQIAEYPCKLQTEILLLETRHQIVFMHEDDAPKMFASMKEERSSFHPDVCASHWAGHCVITSI